MAIGVVAALGITVFTNQWGAGHKNASPPDTIMPAMLPPTIPLNMGFLACFKSSRWRYTGTANATVAGPKTTVSKDILCANRESETPAKGKMAASRTTVHKMAGTMGYLRSIRIPT